jgi:hypothetical protein
MPCGAAKDEEELIDRGMDFCAGRGMELQTIESFEMDRYDYTVLWVAEF